MKFISIFAREYKMHSVPTVLFDYFNLHLWYYGLKQYSYIILQLWIDHKDLQFLGLNIEQQ